MSKINAVCVYCGSSPGTDPAFIEAARKLGKILAENGVRLVYGGEVIGIIPEFLTQRERPRRLAQELVVTRDMHERKRKMFERADAFVALPGGVGTLEEIVEQLTWAQLGRHKKPILFANINGYWDPLLALFAHMREQEFVPDALRINFLVADRVEVVSRPAGAGGAMRKRRWQFLLSGCKPRYVASRKNVTASIRLPSGSRIKAA